MKTYYKISFSSLSRASIELEEITQLAFKPSQYTYIRVFEDKEEANEYFKNMKEILLNLEYIDKLISLKFGSDNYFKKYYKDVTDYYYQVSIHTNYIKLFENLVDLAKSVDVKYLLSTEVIEKINSEINSGDRERVYLQLTNDLRPLEALEKIIEEKNTKVYANALQENIMLSKRRV